MTRIQTINERRFEALERRGAGPARPLERESRENKWPFWMKVTAAATAGLAAGILLASNPVHADPIMCVQNEGAVSTTPCVPKNMLNFFNDYFPNVVLVGADSEMGQETVTWLDHLGISHKSENGYDRTKVPFEVWSRVDEYTVSKELQNRIIDAWNNHRPLDQEETKGLDRLRGAAACYFVNRAVILDTIERYDEAVKKLDTLKNEPDSPEKRALKAEVERYKTIFVFEHNARFGTVREDDSVDLSQETAKGIEKVFKALPDDWELFNLLVFDGKIDIDHTSSRFPGTGSLSSDSVLLHPGFGMATKAYALSYKIYSALKRMFLDEVSEDKVTRTLSSIDLELQQLSLKREKEEGALFQLAAVESLIYRKASPSFHDKQSYSQVNHPSSLYRKLIKGTA